MWENIISAIEAGNNWLNGIVWGWPMIILILGTGIIMTIRTKAMQVRKLGESINSTIVPTIKGLGKKHAEDKGAKSISQFEAFATAISGTVGTGNIIGVTSAILTGGPGAVFWMWISAFFGMITNYSENVLGMYFRKKDDEGNFSGGTAYYISEGLGWKWLGYIAALFCVLAAIGMSGVQTNKISGTLASGFAGFDGTTVKLIVGIIVAIVAALVIIGGIKRIGRVASILVPFMSLLFLVLAIIVIFMHIGNVGTAFASIFKYAFNFKAAGGGIFGYTFSKIIQKGMARGVFSNEAGLGSSVYAHCASETREPVRQGLWGIFEVFFDTFIICTITALMILSSNDLTALTGAEGDAALSLAAFSNNLGIFGTVCFCVILPLFAFTTILAWSYYGEKAVEFLFQKAGKKGQKIATMTFKVIYVVLIVASAVISSDLVWNISDTTNGLMALPNLIAVIGLSGLTVKITKNYYDRKKGLDVKPMLSAYPAQNDEFIKDINSGNPIYR
ncbi:MAG: alanine:cation symporter family protein [Ruminococcaceae bacterium]|nr:alanine:cation symporter family protein [Oscillospiraceae bacterium]